jgi:hypothetical protein
MDCIGGKYKKTYLPILVSAMVIMLAILLRDINYSRAQSGGESIIPVETIEQQSKSASDRGEKPILQFPSITRKALSISSSLNGFVRKVRVIIYNPINTKREK